MLDVLLDTLLDLLKVIPFLFVVFLLMEYFEHKMSEKNKNIITKSGKLGPLVGGLLGAFPQCGFSAAITNLFSTRIISLGTLIAVYLSTSDEMLPIMLSRGTNIYVILTIIMFKVVVGIICGFFIDLILAKKYKNKIKKFCEEEHCHCEESLILSSVIHTIHIALFMLVATFVLNMVVYYVGEESLKKLLLDNTFFGPFVSSLIGLIPNCASSVIITELYLKEALSFGSAMAGLLTGSGVALLLLFKTNKNLKENIFIILLLYFIGVFVGIVTNLLI